MQTRILHALFLRVSVVEVYRLETFGHRTAYHTLGSAGEAQHLHGRCVDIHYVHVGVDNHHALGRVTHDVNSQTLSALAHVGQAYIDVGIAVHHGPGFFAAGAIAAGTTIKLVGFGKFAGTAQHILNLFVAGGTTLGTQARMGVSQRHPCVGRRQMFACGHLVFHIAVDICLSLNHTAIVCNRARSVDAATGTHVHLYEHVVHRLNVFQHIGNTVHAVHCHVSVAFRQSVERAYNALRYRIGFRAVGDVALVAYRKFVYSIQVYAVFFK